VTTAPDSSDPPKVTQITVNQQASDVSGTVAGVEIKGNVGMVTGFSEQAVLRLVIAVGVLVFFTAACFFSGGIVIGVGAFTALNKPATVGPPLALSMQNKLVAINALQPGQSFGVSFSEDEFNSYMNLIAGKRFGLSNASVRLVGDPGSFVVAGNSSSMGNLPVVATFKVTTGNTPIQLRSAAVQLLPFGNSPVGWVAVPGPVASSSVGPLNEQLFQNVRLDSVTASGTPGDPAMTIRGVKR
jgi:uncharacterized membrane protein (Fun14 family)